MANYYLILTDHGSQRLAAAQAGTTDFQILHLALGDANGQPYLPSSRINADTLVNERARVEVIDVTVVDQHVEVVAIVGSEIGGFNLHEIALLDEQGKALYIGNYHGGYKPVLTEGAGGDLKLILALATSGLAPVVIQMNPTTVIADRQWVIDNFVRIPTFDAHVAQNDVEHANLALLIANVVLALQQHQDALNPHPQYALQSQINPRHLFRFVHNTGAPYATHFGRAAGAVIHELEGFSYSLGNCLNDYDPLYVNPVADYVIEDITLGQSLNRQGYLLRFDGYIQFGSYAGQGDTGFSPPTAKIRFLDEDDQLMIEAPLTLSLITTGFPNNGNIGHVMYRVTKDFDLYDLRKTNGQAPSDLKAVLVVSGRSDSDGGSTDLQIMTVEGFSILCSY
jgi:hypothetical protein